MPIDILHFGAFKLDPRARRLLRDAVEFDLPPRAFDLLLLLARSPREVLRRDAIMDALWPDGSEVSEGALSQVVLVLRRGLGPEGASLVRTVAKVGYALEADVLVLPQSAKPTVAAMPAVHGAAPPMAAPAADGAPAAHGVHSAGRRVPWGLRVALGLALLAALAIALRPPASAPGGLELAISGVRVGDGANAAPAWAANALHDLLAARLRGQPGIALRLRDDIEPDPPASAIPMLDGTVRLDPANPGRIVVDWRLRGAGHDAQWRDVVPADRLFEAMPRLQAELRARLHGVPAIDLGSRRRDDAALFDYTAGIQALGEGRAGTRVGSASACGSRWSAVRRRRPCSWRRRCSPWPSGTPSPTSRPSRAWRTPMCSTARGATPMPTPCGQRRSPGTTAPAPRTRPCVRAPCNWEAPPEPASSRRSTTSTRCAGRRAS